MNFLIENLSALIQYLVQNVFMINNNLNIDNLNFKNFKSGKESSYSYFFHKYYPYVVGFCVQFLTDEDKSRSVAQESFIHLWKHKNKIESAFGIKPFLFTYAKSKCLNILRHEKIARKYKNKTLEIKESQLNIEILTSMQFDTVTFNELENRINTYIENLPEPTRTVFVKKRFEHLKNSEVATLLNLSIKSVEAHMTKALKYLRLQLSDYMH